MAQKRSKQINQKNKRRFPTWILFIIGALVILTGWLLRDTISSNNADSIISESPKIKVDRDTFDYGNVQLGTPIYVAVKVTNIGAKPLVFAEAPYIEILEGC